MKAAKLELAKEKEEKARAARESNAAAQVTSVNQLLRQAVLKMDSMTKKPQSKPKKEHVLTELEKQKLEQARLVKQ